MSLDLEKINLGATAGDKTGDGARTGGGKINRNFEKIKAFLETPDAILVQTGYALVGQELTFNSGWKWRIATLEYMNPEDVEIPFPLAAAGKSRLDVVVLTTSNTFLRVAGAESTSTPVAPSAPSGSLYVTVVLVTDGVVNQPEQPEVNGAYVQKSERANVVLTGSGVINQLNLVDEKATIVFKDAITRLNTISYASVPYNGKTIRLFNAQATPVTIGHSVSGYGVDFVFLDGQDYILLPNQTIEFSFDITYAPYAHHMLIGSKGITNWSELQGKPSTFTPSAHTHTKSQITDFAHTHPISDVTGLPTALNDLQLNKEDKANKNIANGYAGLDSSGKIIPTQLPALAITDTFVVASQAEQLALVAEVGDVAVRTDLNKSFILKSTGASTLANWQELLTSVSVDQTIIDGSTNAVSGNAVFDGLALKSNKADFINIKDLGCIGNGVFDNTTIVNNALLTYKEVYFPDGNYLVTSLVNNLGAKITGSGVIVKSIAGGTQQLNTGIDRYNYVFGQEYLSAFQNVIIDRGGNNGITAKVSWSGDSTTAGDGITDGAYLLSNLFKATANVNGIANITSLNRGHSGANTEQWRTLYLADDLAENPDLYIIRWGINDPGWLKNGTTPPLDSGDTYPNRRDISDFETSLRTALSTIRASKSQSEMSIILMSPNGTSDTPNGRDEKWYEQVKKVYIKAARDYKCAFIDTYSLWLDSRGAAGLYMDDPFSDGRAIHPLNIMNTWIVSKVFDLVFPESLKTMVSGGYLNNESSVDRLPLVSDLPETYRKGQTISRSYVAGVGVETPGNWSVDGTVSTIFNTDGSGYQFNTSRFTNNPAIYFRTFKGEYLSEALSWSNTVKLWHSGNDAVFPKLANVNLFTNKMRISGGGVSTSISDVNTTATHIVDVANTSVSLATGYVGSDDVFLQSFNNSSNTIKTLILNPFGGNIVLGGNLAAPNYTGGATLTGTPTAPTAPAGTNTTQVATTAFVQAAARPYKVYTANLFCSGGTNAGLSQIIGENTLGVGNPTISTVSQGTYDITFPSAIAPSTQKIFLFGQKSANQNIGLVQISTSVIRVTLDINYGSITFLSSTSHSIEIRVYN